MVQKWDLKDKALDRKGVQRYDAGLDGSLARYRRKHPEFHGQGVFRYTPTVALPEPLGCDTWGLGKHAELPREGYRRILSASTQSGGAIGSIRLHGRELHDEQTLCDVSLHHLDTRQGHPTSIQYRSYGSPS